MSNWAQEMFDQAHAQAKRMLEAEKLISQLQPLITDIKRSPELAAVQMMAQYQEIQRLKKQLKELKDE